MRLSISRIREIAKAHRPRGWEIVERGPPRTDYFAPYDGPGDFGEIFGYADFEKKTIVCPPLVCRGGLYIYLHEAGHVHFQHYKNSNNTPMWEEEYEAEQYAIKAMRSAGVPVPRAALTSAKKYVQGCINSKCNDESVPDHIYKWAFGSKSEKDNNRTRGDGPKRRYRR